MTTLHKGFNKIMESEAIMNGNVHSTVQSSMYVRGVHNVECNGHDFKTGELHQRDMNIFTEWMRRNVCADSFIRDDFYSKVSELAFKGDLCLYIFHSSAKAAAIAIAIADKTGLQYFYELKGDIKNRSIVNYIKSELNRKGWYS
jgi:hypothetical protein